VSSLGLEPLSPKEALKELMKSLDARLIRRGDDLTGVPYLWRAYLSNSPKSSGIGAFLHRFVSSDEMEYHCHPWAWSYSFILAGSYTEDRAFALDINFGASTATLDGSTKHQRRFWPGDVNLIRAETFHRVQLETAEVVTLFVHGPRVQDWGFVAMNEWGRPIPMRLMTGHTRDRLKPEQVR